MIWKLLILKWNAFSFNVSTVQRNLCQTSILIGIENRPKRALLHRSGVRNDKTWIKSFQLKNTLQIVYAICYKLKRAAQTFSFRKLINSLKRNEQIETRHIFNDIEEKEKKPDSLTFALLHWIWSLLGLLWGCHFNSDDWN